LYFCINGLLNNNIIITSNSKKVYEKQIRKEVVETQFEGLPQHVLEEMGKTIKYLLDKPVSLLRYEPKQVHNLDFSYNMSEEC